MVPPQPVPTTARPVVYVVLAEDRLSRRGRLVAAALALVVLVLLGLGSTWAGFPPVLTGRAPVLASGGDQVIALSPLGCDGPTTHLAWDSTTYSTVELTVVGDRVAAPGDRVGCTVAVANTGPSAAVMTVVLTPEVLAVGAANPDLAEGVYLFWDAAGTGGSARFDTAALGDGVVAEVLVAHGQVVPVEVGFTVPTEVTDHESEGLASTRLSFEVTVRLDESTGSRPPGGQPPTSPPPTSPPTPDPSSPPTGPDPGREGSGRAGPGQADASQSDPSQADPSQSDRPQLDRGRVSGLRLPRTGAEIVGVVAVAGMLLLAGTGLWVAARRRDQRDSSAAGGTR